MPRPLRIEYEDAFYHMAHRGRARQAVFHFEDCFEVFLTTLSEAHRRLIRIRMPIPDAQRATVAVEKVRDYLLNFEHPDGGSKAAWFHSLGYTRDKWQLLAADLLAIARDCDGFDTEMTPFGLKFMARGLVGRPAYRLGRVLTVWIVEDGDPPRLVTTYPNGT